MFSGYSRGESSSSSASNDGNDGNYYQSNGTNVYVPPPRPQHVPPPPQSVTRTPPSSSSSFGVMFGRKISFTSSEDQRLFIGAKTGRKSQEDRKARAASSKDAVYLKKVNRKKKRKMAAGKALLEEILNNQAEEEDMVDPDASTALGAWYFILKKAVRDGYAKPYAEAVSFFLGKAQYASQIGDTVFTLKDVKKEAELVNLYQSSQFLEALQSRNWLLIKEASRLADIGVGILAETAKKALRFAVNSAKQNNRWRILENLLDLEQSPNVPDGLPVRLWNTYIIPVNRNVFVDVLVDEEQTDSLLASVLSFDESFAGIVVTMLNAIVNRLKSLISAEETSLPLNVLVTILASTEAQDGSAYWNRVVDSLNDDEKGFILAQIRRKMAWVEAGTNRDYFRTPSGVTLWNVEQTGLERYIQ